MYFVAEMQWTYHAPVMSLLAQFTHCKTNFILTLQSYIKAYTEQQSVVILVIHSPPILFKHGNYKDTP